jgi:hypothetical protein
MLSYTALQGRGVKPTKDESRARVHAMKAYGKVEFHSTALCAGEWSASRSDRFTQAERGSVNY